MKAFVEPENPVRPKMRYAVAIAVFVAVLVVGGLVFLVVSPAAPPVENVEKTFSAGELPQ